MIKGFLPLLRIEAARKHFDVLAEAVTDGLDVAGRKCPHEVFDIDIHIVALVAFEHLDAEERTELAVRQNELCLLAELVIVFTIASSATLFSAYSLNNRTGRNGSSSYPRTESASNESARRMAAYSGQFA